MLKVYISVMTPLLYIQWNLHAFSEVSFIKFPHFGNSCEIESYNIPLQISSVYMSIIFSNVVEFSLD